MDSGSQVSNGDIHISANGFEDLAIVNFYPKGFREEYINGKLTSSPKPDSEQFRRECIYNAKLITCSPEMLEKLIHLLKLIDNEDIIIKDNIDNDGNESIFHKLYKDIILTVKKATS